ncbi:group III truncated hemoglobin [Stagnihabitans tardus]|uniref:Globin family protein n=1 Tax=Stagnihabitans tardus TaxID=2699202 RepID=A0AAE5BVY4_9RHOB|nr:group III truncated hemoglobin [Stagnihabitans tardus]NBZ88249.1 globin family protein [Stagnihabitans tardus]
MDQTQALPPRFIVTDAEIALVVEEFYEAIRQHPGLGPVFAAHVTDWPAHEAKIAGFWRNAIRSERSYEGNPMRVHAQAGDVRPGMFIPWLGLFDSVLKRNLAPETAAAWSALAHRIGESLMMGLMRWNQGVPNLKGGA